jgi:hypothetical protein
MDLKNSYESDHNQFPSYMLIEATGDSEVDSNDPNIDGFGSADDDDDAQSCCHDNAAEFKACESWNDDDDDDVEKNKKGDVNVYGSSYCEDDEMQEQNNYKSYVSDDSSDKEFVDDEMEKNRLFWEACLAS